MKKKIIIIGKNSFIGSNLYIALRNKLFKKSFWKEKRMQGARDYEMQFNNILKKEEYKK